MKLSARQRRDLATARNEQNPLVQIEIIESVLGDKKQ
jgi:hypothetical protein